MVSFLPALKKDTIFDAAQTKLGPSYFVAALVIPYKAKAEGLTQSYQFYKGSQTVCKEAYNY